MLSQVIWWGGILLEVLLLARGVQTKLVFRYKFFYSYILCVFLESVVRLMVRTMAPELYTPVYWVTEFIALAVGCGVVYEIYKLGLVSFPGTARMARVVVAALFGLVMLKAFVGAADDPGWLEIAGRADFELNLRVVQAILISALVALFLGYSISFGTNLRGIVTGYGLVVALRVLRLSFPSLGWESLREMERYVSPVTYLLALGLWTAYLWSYVPAEEPAPPVHLERDYQEVAEATRRRLRAARSYLGRAVGS